LNRSEKEPSYLLDKAEIYGAAMNKVKDWVLSAVIVFVFLCAAFGYDDTYEDSKLSAQVLDEAIAQAYADKQTVKHELVASTSIK
jgi:hypothetical protein